MEAVFICARTKKLFCLKFSYREQAPSLSTGTRPIKPPNLTNYPPWNAINCGRGLAPDSNGPATTKLQPKKMPQPIDRGISY